MGALLVDGAGHPSRGWGGVLEGTGGADCDKPPVCDDNTVTVCALLIAHGTVVLTALWTTSSGNPAGGEGSVAAVTIVVGTQEGRYTKGGPLPTVNPI